MSTFLTPFVEFIAKGQPNPQPCTALYQKSIFTGNC